MEPIETVRRLRSMFNLARTAGLLVALSVSLAGCATDTSITGTAPTSPVREAGPYPISNPSAPDPHGKGTDGEGKCPSPLGPNDMHADYVDFIHYDGRSYVLAGELPAEANKDALVGRKLGTVQCQLQGRDTDGYELGSGDASFLDPGAPFFARKGKPIDRQIVVDDGRLVLYAVGAKGAL